MSESGVSVMASPLGTSASVGSTQSTLALLAVLALGVYVVWTLHKNVVVPLEKTREAAERGLADVGAAVNSVTSLPALAYNVISSDYQTIADAGAAQGAAAATVIQQPTAQNYGTYLAADLSPEALLFQSNPFTAVPYYWNSLLATYRAWAAPGIQPL